MVFTLFSAFFAGLWDAFLDKIGMSPQERLGKEETIVKMQATELSNVKTASTTHDTVASLSDNSVEQQLREQWQKPE